MKSQEIKMESFFKISGEIQEINIKKYFNKIFAGKNSTRELNRHLNLLSDFLKKNEKLDQAKDIYTIVFELAAEKGIDEISLSTEILNELFLSSSEKKGNRSERKSDHDKRKKQIFEASIDVFSRKGYHGATMDEIASVAGMGKGSVYRYFKSKEELLRQLLSEKYDEIIKRFSFIMERDADVMLQIQEMIIIWIEFIEENHSVYNLIQNNNIQKLLGEEINFYDFFVTHLPMLKEKILELSDAHKLKTTGFYTVFYGILGFIDGVAQKWFRRNMNYPLSSEVPIILEVLFNGFVGEKNSGKNFIDSA